MKKFIFALLCCLSFFLASIWSTELSPWYSRYLELQPQASYSYQFYPSINCVNKKKRYASHNHFLDLSISGAYDRWSLEIESNFAMTRHRNFSFSDVRLTARYQWLDDIVGDPLSLVTGVTLIQDVKLAKNDISCFYHGYLEGEFHLAIGKETSCQQFWTSRLWAFSAFGIADEGSPWLKGNIIWEHNYWDLHEVSLGVFSLLGLGGNNLNIDRPFKGYGSIAHYSIDLKLSYHYSLFGGGILGADYTYRLYAHNCPKYVNTFELSFLYPFGL